MANEEWIPSNSIKKGTGTDLFYELFPGKFSHSYASFIGPIVLMVHGFSIGISSKISDSARAFSKSDSLLSWSVFRTCK